MEILPTSGGFKLGEGEERNETFHCSVFGG